MVDKQQCTRNEEHYKVFLQSVGKKRKMDNNNGTHKNINNI